MTASGNWWISGGALWGRNQELHIFSDASDHFSVFRKRGWRMKRRMMLACGLAVALLMVFSDDSSMGREPVPGGWSPAAVSDENVVAAAAFAVQDEEKAIRKKGGEKSARLKLIAIREAEQQVVAGINYRLTLTVKLNGQEKTAEAVVWWQEWRKPDPYQLTSWDWK